MLSKRKIVMTLLIALSVISLYGCKTITEPVENIEPIEVKTSQTVETPDGYTRPNFGKGLIEIVNSNDKKIDINVEIAKTSKEQSHGLMYKTDLRENEGMWFPYDKERNLTFWMKNTLIPLDIIFIDANNKIINISKNTPPCKSSNCPTYSSTSPAKYVLELNAGFSDNHFLNTGDKIYLLIID